MKASTSSILSLALALNGALASPLRARDYAVVTVTEVATRVVHVTATTWVDPAQYNPTEGPTTTTSAINPNEKHESGNHVPISTPSTTLSTTTPTTTSTSSTSIPTTTIPPTTLETSTLPVTTTSISISPVKIEPSTTAPAPAPSLGANTPSVGSGGGTYTGDGTFYSPGLGACGITSSDSDYIVAISTTLFDAQGTGNPNKNPLCGKKIVASYNGGPGVTVTITDRCEGCKQYDLDFSPTAFQAMGAKPDQGRVSISWSYAS